MKKIISMAVMLYITMTAMAQKGELAMNENKKRCGEYGRKYSRK